MLALILLLGMHDQTFSNVEASLGTSGVAVAIQELEDLDMIVEVEKDSISELIIFAERSYGITRKGLIAYNSAVKAFNSVS